MTQAKITKRLQGRVVSDAMDKTVVVAVDTLKTHSKYNKKYTATKKYKAHDQENMYHVGDHVTIEAVRPVSKDKTFVVVTE